MFKCVQIMCAKYDELMCMFSQINFTSLMLARGYGVKIGVIFGVRFERRKVDKKANLHENRNMQTLF